MAAILARRWTAVLMGLAAVGPPAALAADDASSWGPASNGVRCRVVALDPKTDDEAPDMSRVVDSFANADEVTLGVELQNASDQPVKLLGVRYGDGYGAAKGKLHAASMGPVLFALEITDATGRSLARPKRELLQPDHHVDSTSLHPLAPGESLVVALRPAQFHYNFDDRLPPGDYQVRVRYLGLEDRVRDRILDYAPTREQLGAWSGDARSNFASISVGGEREDLTSLHWGEEVDGLRAAVTLTPHGSTGSSRFLVDGFQRGSAIETTLHVQNVSDRPIILSSDSWRQDDRVTLTNHAGSIVPLRGAWFTGWPVMVRWTLQPGEVAKIKAGGMAISRQGDAQPNLQPPVCHSAEASPGTYAIRYECWFGRQGPIRDGKGNPLYSVAEDWQGVLLTGAAPLVVR